MPVHDWTRVSAGTFHHFHNQWMGDISDCLNNGLLPADHYALIEQVSGEVVPDVVTLHERGASVSPQGNGTNGGTLATLSPPRVRFTASGEMDLYARKQRSLVIRHSKNTVPDIAK